MASTKRDIELAKVQDLYLLQAELWNFLDDDKVDAGKLKSAKAALKEYNRLLSEVDKGYMGGLDVYESLQWTPEEVTDKLKAQKTT